MDIRRLGGSNPDAMTFAPKRRAICGPSADSRPEAILTARNSFAPRRRDASIARSFRSYLW
jgi:hypothetical protein